MRLAGVREDGSLASPDDTDERRLLAMALAANGHVWEGLSLMKAPSAHREAKRWDIDPALRLNKIQDTRLTYREAQVWDIVRALCAYHLGLVDVGITQMREVADPEALRLTEGFFAQRFLEWMEEGRLPVGAE